MEKLITVLFFAGVTKALVEYLSTVVEIGGKAKRIASIIVGEVIAFGSMCDAFELVGTGFSVPFLGVFLTGILISGGANLIYDAFNPDNKTILKEEEKTIAEINERG